MSKLDYDRPTGFLLFNLALPLIGKLLVAELYNVVDTFFVGRMLGASALGPLGLVFPMQRFLFSLPLLVGVGTSTKLSRYLGGEEYSELGKIVASGALMLVVLQSSFALVIYFKSIQVMEFFGASGGGLVSSASYLGYSSLGSIFFGLNNFLSFVLISFGNTRVSLVSLLLGALLNGILDPIFLGPLGFGLEGAALASMLSQLVGATYALIFFIKLARKRGFRLKKPSINYYLPILLGGISAFIIEIEDSFVLGILNRLLLAEDGELGVMVLNLITKLSMFLFIALFGIASAMQPLAAYFYGSENKKRLRELLKKSLVYSFLLTFLIWLIFMLRAEFFVGLFIGEEDTLLLVARVFRLVILAFPLTSLYYINIFYAQALGEGRRALVLSLLRQIFLLIPLSLIFVKGLGLGSLGVWISYPITDISASLLSFFSLRNRK